MPPALHGTYAIYQYTPSIVAAVIFVILFFFVTAAHTWRMFTAKTWFCTAFIIGGIFEFIGYAGRCASHYNPPALTPYIIQSILLLVAPALFAATIYMFLGRIIRSVDAEDLALIRTKWLTTIFVTGDVLSFFVQAGGAGIMVQGNGNSMKTGQNIILGGLFIQILWFALFLTVGLIFAQRMDRREKSTGFKSALPWLKMMKMLYAVSALILLRNVFRVVEYIMGQDGYLLGHEWSLYIFDAVPMLGVMTIFLVWYPTQLYLQSTDVEMGDNDGQSTSRRAGRSTKELAENDVNSVRSG